MIDTLAHLLLPRKSNNHKAKLLHSSSLAILVLIFVFLQGIFGFASSKTGKVLGYAANISPSEVERLTNIQRANNGLPPVTDDPVLDAGALAKGQDMLAKGYWAHVSPDGTQPWAFFVSAGYSYKYAGENLARDFSDAQSAVDAWMNSPSHRENMLSPNYKDIGIGVVEGNLAGADTTIIVQFFGTKLGDALPTQPVAEAKTPQPSATPIVLPAVVQESQTPEPISPLPVSSSQPLVASSQVTPFDVTKYLSLGLVGTLIVVVAVDGFLINKRKIFRIAGHFPAHIAFLGMILVIVVIAKAGRII
ncbi:hypothetical protein BH10PAT1_BH10PAT1_4040 [soil metagenome]